MRGQRFQPLRLDGGDSQCIEARGFKKGSGDDPLATVQKLMGARKNHQLLVAWRKIEFVLLFTGDIAQQAGCKGHVDLLVVCFS